MSVFWTEVDARLNVHIWGVHFSWLQACSNRDREHSRKKKGKKRKTLDISSARLTLTWLLLSPTRRVLFVFCACYPSILASLWLSYSVGWTIDTVEIPPKSLTSSLSVAQWPAFTLRFVSFAQSQCPPLSLLLPLASHPSAVWLSPVFLCVQAHIRLLQQHISTESYYFHRIATADIIWRAIPHFPSRRLFILHSFLARVLTVSWMLTSSYIALLPLIAVTIWPDWPYSTSVQQTGPHCRDHWCFWRKTFFCFVLLLADF